MIDIEADKMAPVQGYTPGIPWSMHLEAYDVYRKKYGAQQALIEGWCRGGFGTVELDEFIPGWREKVSEIGKLKAEIADLRAVLAAKLAPMTPDEIVAMAKLYSDYDDTEQFERMVRAVEAHHSCKRFTKGDANDCK